MYILLMINELCNDDNKMRDFSFNHFDYSVGGYSNYIPGVKKENNLLEISPTNKEVDHNSQLEINNRINYDKHEFKIDYLENSSKTISRNILLYLKTTNPLQWVFLVFFSLVITIICSIFDYILKHSLNYRFSLCNSQNTFLNFILWVSTCFLLLLMATSMGYFISSDADGSGIPELKTVISGINIYRYFSVEAFIGKVLGLFCALLGGMLFY
jgi:hypothetical protein